MPFVLGKASKAKLEGVHPDLVRVVWRAIEITTQDFSVVEGVRTKERQAELYAQGRTKPGPVVTWTMNSKHIPQADGYGHAVDLMPYPISWAETPENRERQVAVVTAMVAAAKGEGVSLRLGSDWNMNGIPGEKGESDWPHFELVERKSP